jgi:hypothetical protein
MDTVPTGTALAKMMAMVMGKVAATQHTSWRTKEAVVALPIIVSPRKSPMLAMAITRQRTCPRQRISQAHQLNRCLPRHY